MYGGPGGFDPKLVVQGTIADGTPLEFYVDGVRAQCAQPGGAWSDTFPFAAGGITELNLRVLGPTPTETPTNTPTSTPTSTPSPTSTPTRFRSSARWVAAYGTTAGGWSTQDKYPRHVADVNGDGLADVVGFGDAGPYVSLSTGSSFGASNRWGTGYGYVTGGWTSQNLYPRFLADVNKDGKADVVGFGKYGAYVSLSTGSSFAAPVLGIANFGTNQGWSSQNLYPRTLGDVNHDHRADIVGFASSGAYVSLSQW